MLIRLLLLAFGVFEFLFPRRVVDWGMKHSLQNGSDIEVKPWVYTVARIEGLVITLWALRRGKKKRGASR
ncbi:hypothetical protein SAMN05421858_1472 [Haladaptatus litoreus]|uniref:DUF6199 domain-containing protein n=1 Tax=Haladaptatus litoreus TaxID=553468 RepID=A0A1N6Y9J4_9EURY|nr:hypothetical protein [Haladaptatus litoreus]SIR11305.1 hypothetical protein SAMN05421858_1472 [Haladaptatus litoreus]